MFIIELVSLVLNISKIGLVETMLLNKMCWEHLQAILLYSFVGGGNVYKSSM